MADTPTSASRSGGYAKGRQRREEILKAALEVLAELGYRKTSLRAIARELGLQPAHVLHYFASREDLLLHVIQRWGEPSKPEEQPGGTPFLERWIRQVEHNTTVPGLVHLYTAFAAEAADPGHPAHDYFAGRFRRLRELIAAEVEAGIESGALREDLAPDDVAVSLISLSDGLQLQWLVDPEIDMPSRMRDAVEVLRARPAVSRS